MSAPAPQPASSSVPASPSAPALAGATELPGRAHARRHRGAPPGLLHIGQRGLDAPRVSLIEYDDKTFTERELSSLAECTSLHDPALVTWLNVDGARTPGLLKPLEAVFGLHPLVIEDVLNGEQRPKLEEYDGLLFIVLKMFSYDEAAERIVYEHVSLVVGPTFVITFQERAGDVFDGVRERLRNSIGRIRKHKGDYLAYRLLDAIVDGYFVTLDAMTDLVEEVETRVADDVLRVPAREMHMLKREVLFLRRSILPARELLGSLSKSEDSEVVRPQTLPFLRDVADHVVQVTESLEVLHDILVSALETHQAALANRMNEIMKVMAIISTIFIPLSWIAGVYGMNFEHMPELSRWWAYPAVLALMGTLAIGMVVYFRRKRWF